ncbi:MAG: four helix bundle protein [candidate division WOR-3 bacterium]|nr:MAG: four helix bundle protein [candidate division WOR-3 bacterium]
MMKKLKSFRDLVVWKLASEFSKVIASLIKKFPDRERYALSDDLLRAARSIPANIAEGWGRWNVKEKIQFYNIANASAEECANHLIEAVNNKYLDEEKSLIFQKKIHVIAVKLTNLMNVTRKRIRSSGSKQRP